MKFTAVKIRMKKNRWEKVSRHNYALSRDVLMYFYVFRVIH